MRTREAYWSYKAPPDPELRDLPPASFKGDERAWESLSPGFRRTIWREAIQREAMERGLSAGTVLRLRIATISGGLGSLDEYLMVFEREDAARPAIREDADRLQRADAMHRQSEIQIEAREAL